MQENPTYLGGFTSEPNAKCNHRFYLFVLEPTPSETESRSVFFWVETEQLAEALSQLLSKEYSNSGKPAFDFNSSDEFDRTERILLDERIDYLASLDEPDIGAYDPQPTLEMFAVAEYTHRALHWEKRLRDEVKGTVEQRGATVASSASTAANK